MEGGRVEVGVIRTLHPHKQRRLVWGTPLTALDHLRRNVVWATRQVCMLAHQLGFKLPNKVTSEMWNWEKLWKEGG